MIAAVVAADERDAIGIDGGMLMSIPEDLKMFRELTSGHVVIMGRKTYDALPCGPLPNRVNVVITSRAQKDGHIAQSNNGAAYYMAGMDEVKSWLREKAKDHAKHHFIIGGGVIYEELLPYCERVYLTRIHKTFERADTWFPDVANMPDWQLTNCGEMKTCDDVTFQFCIYGRKK